MPEPVAKTVFLGPDSHLAGTLTADHDAAVMGRFDGELRLAGFLDLTESARVRGVVIANRIRVAGHLDADVLAGDYLEVLATAVIRGRVFTPRLSLAPGARMEGFAKVGPGAVEAGQLALQAVQARATEGPGPRPDPTKTAVEMPVARTQPEPAGTDDQPVPAEVETTAAPDAMPVATAIDGETATVDVSTVPRSLEAALQSRRPVKIIVAPHRRPAL